MIVRAAQKQRPAAADFDRIAKQAAEVSEQNRLEEATRLYRQAVVLRPQWAEGWWSLGTLEYDRDHYVAAAHAFRKLLRLAPKNGTAHVMLGLSEFELGEDREALKQIQEGDALGVENNAQLREVALFHEGILLLRAGKYVSALAPLRALCETRVRSNELVQTLGLTVFGLTPKAAPPEGTPGHQVIFGAGHAECLAAGKHTGQAREEYQSLLSEYPDYPDLHYAYGRFLLEMHDTDGAVKQFKEELKNNPEQVNAMLEIAAVRYRVDSARGLKYAEVAVKLAPQLPFAHYLLGLLYLDTDQAQAAIPHLQAARRAFPNEPSVYFALGTAYAKVGRKEDAARARAVFLRLNQEAGKQGGATVYGGQTLGPSEQKLRVGRTDIHPN